MPSILLALALVIGGAIVLPVAFLVAESFQSPGGGPTTWAHYLEVLSSKYYLGSLGATLLFCSATAALATLLAIPGAQWMAKRRSGSSLLRMLCQANFAFSGVVYGMLVVTLLGNAGVVSLLEAWAFGTDFSRGYVYTTGGLAIGYLGFQTPRAALLLAQALERVDPQLLAAARVLGATRAQRFLLVTLPQIARPLLVTFLAIAMMSMASFGTALLVARTIDIFPLLIYREFTGFGEINRAAAMGVILAICCVALEVMARRATGSSHVRTRIVKSSRISN
jgi:putative spermidine/putrescine transport system permease protein